MRVAITGMGIVCPAGNNLQEFRARLREGKQRLGHLTGVPLPRGKSAVGLVMDSRFGSTHRAYEMCRAAVSEALEMAGVSVQQERNIALLLSTLAADSGTVEKLYPKFAASGSADQGVSEVLSLYSNGTLLSRLGNHFGFDGPRFVVSNACASGNIALGLALDMMRSKRCRVAVVPGVELVKLSMLWGAERSAFIGRALRPFHRQRDGSILGEGAAAVVVQREEDVDAANVLGWLEGFGFGVEATAGAITLKEDGSGLRRSMTFAVEDAGRSLDEIQYINAHAPGTPAIDRIECKAISELFGTRSTSLYVNSTKSLTTHLSAASGIVEVIATLVQMQEGFIHGNGNLDDPDPALAVPVVGPDTVLQKVRRSLSNACGGGGLNTTVLITAADEPSPGSEWPQRKQQCNIAITGTGIISPWSNGNSKAPRPGYLEWFDVNRFYPAETGYSYYNRTGQLGAAAAAVAVGDASLQGHYADDRVAVITGTFLGGQTQCNAAVCQALMDNPNSITPSMVLDHGPHLASSMVRRHYGYFGPTCTFTGSCVAGLQALLTGCEMLLGQRADAGVIVGNDGLDEALRKAAAMLNGCLPADRLSEGAGAAVIELQERAQRRGARVHALIRDWTITASNLQPSRALKATAERLAGAFQRPDWETIFLTGHHKQELQELASVFMTSVGRKSKIHIVEENLCCLAGDPMFALSAAVAAGKPALILAAELQGIAAAVFIEPQQPITSREK